MQDLPFEDIEVAPPSVVRQAADDFAEALAKTPQFKAFEQAVYSFRHNQAAQQAMQAYKEKQQSLRALLLLNALSHEQRAELERLESEFTNQPTAMEFLQAQTELTILCQVLGDMLSEAIGLNYAAACGARCCG